MKKKKLKNKLKINLLFRLKNLFKPKTVEEKFKDTLQDIQKINTENLSDHREKFLSKSRKFIYPLGRSKHRLVRLSIYLFVLAVILFISFCSIELYASQSTSTFIYTVSEVIPFPVAKVGNRWIDYKSYLFELRRNMHYYESQQGVNFSSTGEKAQLINLKQQAMSRVIEDAFTSILANQYHVKVSSQQINNEISLLQSQNKLGSSPSVLNSVLNDYWGWNINDFKHELSLELLQENVAYTLDTQVKQEANSIYSELLKGANFATLASQYSDDLATKSNGGQYPGLISRNDPSLAPQVINTLFKLKVGQTSTPIYTGSSLEILRLNGIQGNQLNASHIQLNINPISVYINKIKKNYPIKKYISF